MIQVRHEEAAAFAACGYAKFTRRLGVCLATSGPGGLHLLNGLYDAKCDGQPVLAITGHTFHDLIGTHYQQDVDLVKVFSDVAAYNERVMGPAHVCNVVDEAVKTAIARRTVAHITIPKDIQDWSADGQRSKANIAMHSGDLYSEALPLPPKATLRHAADMLNAGTKVAILAGRGCLTARKEILALAEKPRCADRQTAARQSGRAGRSSLHDRRHRSARHGAVAGGVGRVRYVVHCRQQLSVSRVLSQAGAGQSRPDRSGLLPHRTALSGGCRIDRPVLGRAARLAVAHRAENRPDVSSKAQARMRQWNELMEMRGTRIDLPLKPQVVARALNEFLDHDAIICSDTGTVTTWAARHILIRGDMEFSVSGTLATMANGLAYSIGAAVAFPGRQVVCFTGDGGLTMLMGELATIAKYRLPVKVIVIKNNVLGMIKWEQLAFEGNPQYGVQLQPIDFVAVARACGIAGFSVEDPDLVRAVLGEAFHHAGPALVEASSIPTSRRSRARLRPIRPGSSRRPWRKGKRIDGTSSKRSSRTRSEKWCSGPWPAGCSVLSAERSPHRLKPS